MARRLYVLAVVLVAIACGSNSTPTAPTPTQASITATASPNPVTATVCSPPCVGSSGNSFQFRAAGTLTIQETAGIGGNIDSITVSSTVFTPADVTQRSGTSRVAAMGTLLFPLNFVYGPAGTTASRSTVFPITVTFTDDRGNHLTVVMQWAAN